MPTDSTPNTDSIFQSFSFENDYFLSYSSEDVDFARKIVGALRNADYLVWHDESHIGVGDYLRDEINRGITKARSAIILLTPFYYDKLLKSRVNWLKTELRAMYATEEVRGKYPVIPINLGLTKNQMLEIEPEFVAKHRIDLDVKHAYEKQIDQILAKINTLHKDGRFQISIIRRFSNALELARGVEPKSEAIDIVKYAPLAGFVYESLQDWVTNNNYLDVSYFEHLYKLLTYHNRKGETRKATLAIDIFRRHVEQCNNDQVRTLLYLESADVERKTAKSFDTRIKLLSEVAETRDKLRKLTEHDSAWTKYYVRAFDINGLILQQIRRFDDSIKIFEKGINLAQASGQRIKLDFITYNCALSYVQIGEFEQSQRLFEESEKLLLSYEEESIDSGDSAKINWKGKGFLAFAKAQLCYFSGDHKQREQHLVEALEYFVKSEEIRRTSHTYYHLILSCLSHEYSSKNLHTYQTKFEAYSDELHSVEEFKLQEKLLEIRIRLQNGNPPASDIEYLLSGKVISKLRGYSYSLLPVNTYQAFIEYYQQNSNEKLALKFTHAGRTVADLLPVSI